jgi:hypothetical protein
MILYTYADMREQSFKWSLRLYFLCRLANLGITTHILKYTYWNLAKGILVKIPFGAKCIMLKIHIEGNKGNQSNTILIKPPEYSTRSSKTFSKLCYFDYLCYP